MTTKISISRSLLVVMMLSSSVLVPVVWAGDASVPPPPLMIDPSAVSSGGNVEPAPAPVPSPAPAPVVQDPTPEPTPAPVPRVAEPLPVTDEVQVPQVTMKDLGIQERPKKKKKSLAKKAISQTEKTENMIQSLIDAGDVEHDSLTMKEALQEAYLSNPTLRAARAQVKATYEEKPQAAAYWQPNIDASVDVTYKGLSTDPGETEGGLEKSAGVTLVQPLFRGGRTLASVRVADARVDAQLAILATTERAILFQTAQAYMDVLRAQANVGVNERNRDVIARQLKATNDRFRVGDVTRTDVSQSEFRLAQAQAELTTAIGTLRAARAVFEQLVGRLPERLVLPVPIFDFPGQVDEAVKMAETYNPDVIMAEALRYAAEKNIDVAFGALLPEISLNAAGQLSRDPVGAEYDSSEVGTLGVSLTMPLYEGGALKSSVRQAKYTANQKFMNVLEARRAAREETVRAWEDLSAARAEMKSREAQVRAAEIARAGVREEADVGERTILDALDADQEVRNAQIALIHAKRNEIVAEYALASAMGLLVPGNVGVEEKAFDPQDFGKRVGGVAFGQAIFAPAEVGTEAELEAETGH